MICDHGDSGNLSPLGFFFPQGGHTTVGQVQRAEGQLCQQGSNAGTET